MGQEDVCHIQAPTLDDLLKYVDSIIHHIKPGCDLTPIGTSHVPKKSSGDKRNKLVRENL